MKRREIITKLATVLGVGAVLSLHTPKVKAEVGSFGTLTTLADSIPNVDHTPQAHREAINSLLVGLGSTERPYPSAPEDQRIVLPDSSDEAFPEQVRRALIAFGIGKEAD